MLLGATQSLESALAPRVNPAMPEKVFSTFGKHLGYRPVVVTVPDSNFQPVELNLS